MILTTLFFDLLRRTLSRHGLLSLAALGTVLTLCGVFSNPFHRDSQQPDSQIDRTSTENPASHEIGQVLSDRFNEWEASPEQQETLRKLEFSQEGFDWRADWWKYLILILGSLLILLILLYITHLFFRLIITTVALIGALVGSLFIGPKLEPILQPIVPESLASKIQPAYLAFLLAFLVCYIILTALVGHFSKRR